MSLDSGYTGTKVWKLGHFASFLFRTRDNLAAVSIILNDDLVVNGRFFGIIVFQQKCMTFSWIIIDCKQEAKEAQKYALSLLVTPHLILIS